MEVRDCREWSTSLRGLCWEDRMVPVFLFFWLQVPSQAPSSPAPPASESRPDRRNELNLLGKTEAGSGESRRNENVQFNLIDNGALKELKIRLGTAATLIPAFLPERDYFGAEFGDRPAPVVHIGDARMSPLHGSLYEAHNNSVFSARSFFQVGGVKPAHQNDYGFAVGTPLWHGSFISLDGSQQKIRGSVNGNVLVPTQEERTPLTSDPAKRAIVERFLGAYPRELPNRTDINERMLNTNSPQTIDTNNATGALEQQLNERDRLKFSYQFTSQQVHAFELIAGQNPDTTTKAHGARMTYTRAWTPSTVADISMGFDRLHSLIVPEQHSVGPSVSFGSVLEPLGPSSDLPIDRVQNRFRYAGQLRRTRGNHTWIAGAELARRQVNGYETSSQRGVIYFRNDFGRDAITNFRMGFPNRFSTGIGEARRGFRNWEAQVFAGDNWKLSPTLNVNYGLRYQPVMGPHEVNQLTLIPYGCDCNNLAPRFGFAKGLPGNWGILRGAYGIQFGEIFPVTFQQLRFNPPRFRKIEVQAPDLGNPLGRLTAEQLGPDARTTLFVLPPNLVTPYSHQYNFSWEPRLSSKWRMQMGYVGSRTHKILMLWTTNRAQAVPGVPQVTETIEQRRPDQRHFEVRQVLNGSRAYFDAARVSLLQSNWRGLTLEAVYWFSKAIDVGANYTNTAASEDARQGRSQAESLVLQDLKGVSAFDQSHSFLSRIAYVSPMLANANFVTRTAFGRWEFSAVFLAKTGLPFDVMTGSDGPGFGNVDGAMGDRPNILDPSILGRTIGDPDTSRALLPRSAFSYIAATQSRGSIGHNVFRKGGIRNVNAALSRTWRVDSKRTLALRAESINLLNTPQFAAPGNELASSNFGQITNTLNDGRTFQFAVRFSF